MEFPEFTISIKGIVKPNDFPEGRFMGEEVAKWFKARLREYEVFDCEEDWGWYMSINNKGYCVIIGIYDYLNDIDGKSAWGIRTFNTFSIAGLFNRRRERSFKGDIIERICSIVKNDADIEYMGNSVE